MTMGITPEAGTVLSAQISDVWKAQGTAFRLEESTEGQISLGHGPRQDGDVELQYAGEPVLYVPESLASRLGDVMVDITHVPEGITLAVRPAA
ncbi:MAG: hypothetical protein HY682_01140 [Chloroflexi bacterium]|nr:hypothetical protein [Chloroflexota bacterium]